MGQSRSPLRAIFLLHEALGVPYFGGVRSVPPQFLDRSYMCGIQKCERFPNPLLSSTSSTVFWVFVGQSFKIPAPTLSSQEGFFPLSLYLLLIVCTAILFIFTSLYFYILSLLYLHPY